MIVLDQLTKWWAVSTLDDRTIDLFWTLRLQLTHNTGASFSLATGSGGQAASASRDARIARTSRATRGSQSKRQA